MKIAAVAVLGLLGALCPCLRAQTRSPLNIVQQAAGELLLMYIALSICFYFCLWINETWLLVLLFSHTANWTGTLPCGGWDCDCAFRKPKGCCCVSAPLFQLEEATFMRMMDLWKDLHSLNNQIKEITGNTHSYAHQFTHLSIFSWWSKSKCFYLLKIYPCFSLHCFVLHQMDIVLHFWLQWHLLLDVLDLSTRMCPSLTPTSHSTKATGIILHWVSILSNAYKNLQFGLTKHWQNTMKAG